MYICIYIYIYIPRARERQRAMRFSPAKLGVNRAEPGVLYIYIYIYVCYVYIYIYIHVYGDACKRRLTCKNPSGFRSRDHLCKLSPVVHR